MEKENYTQSTIVLSLTTAKLENEQEQEQYSGSILVSDSKGKLESAMVELLTDAMIHEYQEGPDENIKKQLSGMDWKQGDVYVFPLRSSSGELILMDDVRKCPEDKFFVLVDGSATTCFSYGQSDKYDLNYLYYKKEDASFLLDRKKDLESKTKEQLIELVLNHELNN